MSVIYTMLYSANVFSFFFCYLKHLISYSFSDPVSCSFQSELQSTATFSNPGNTTVKWESWWWFFCSWWTCIQRDMALHRPWILSWHVDGQMVCSIRDRFLRRSRWVSACKVYSLMLFWLSCGYFSCQSANFCCHRYVEHFRHGQPWSREERQQMASAHGEEWWASHSSVPNSTPSKAEYKGIFSLTAAFICRLLNGYKLMSFVESL